MTDGQLMTFLMQSRARKEQEWKNRKHHSNQGGGYTPYGR